MYKTYRILLLQTDYFAICYYMKNNSIVKSNWEGKVSGMRNDEKKIEILVEQRLESNTIA